MNLRGKADAREQFIVAVKGLCLPRCRKYTVAS